MTSLMICPSCGRWARFSEYRDLTDLDYYLVCGACDARTDDAELAAAQPNEDTYASNGYIEPYPVTRIDVSTDCGGKGNLTPYVMSWIRATFRYSDGIEIKRFEVHV